MKVQVVRSFGAYAKGQVFNPPGGQADLLTRLGFVVPFKAETAVSSAEQAKPQGVKRVQRR